jgi:hypothetical protein
LGILFWIIPIVIFSGVIYSLIHYLEFLHAKQVELFLVNVVVLILVHNKRKDSYFLKNLLVSEQLKIVYFLEYFLISIPFIVLAIGGQNWIHFAIILIMIVLSFISFSVGRKTKPISIFKRWNIEWNSGFRIYGLAPVIVVGFFIASFFLPTTNYLNIFIFGMVFLSFSSFQSIEEGATFIRIFDCSPGQFLMQKVKTNLRPLVMVGLVAVVPVLMVEMDHWLIIVLVIAQGLVYNVNTVLGNYANYQNEAGKLITFFVKIIFTVIPFLLPLNLLLSVFLYRKAMSSLKPYLHASD